MKKITIIPAALLAAVIIAGCGSSMQIASKYSSQSAIIDGNDNDWEGKTVYLKDEKMLVGFQNDGDNLYVLVSASDKARQMQIMGLGLIIWFDEKGGTDKKFGIKYPVGLMPAETPFMRDNGPEDGEGFRPESGDMGMPEKFSELEIYEDETESWTKMGYREAKGVEIKIGRRNDRVIYELKIALQPKDNIYYLTENNGKIGVEIETNEIDREKIKQGMKRGGIGGPGGGMGGEGMGAPGGDMGGGGMGPRGGGKGGMMRQKMQTPQFKEWFEVTLAGK